MSYKPAGIKKIKIKKKNPTSTKGITAEMLGFSLDYVSQRQHIAVLKDSLLSILPCLTAYSLTFLLTLKKNSSQLAQTCLLSSALNT